MDEHSQVIHVAVDGSDGGRRALAWALEEAVTVRCAVEIVAVYTDDTARPAAEQSVQETIDQVVSDDRPARVPLSWLVVRGDVADALVRESARARMLVMGSHGVSGLRHAALGSVADLCARTAACPVVIIPPNVQLVHHDVGQLA